MPTDPDEPSARIIRVLPHVRDQWERERVPRLCEMQRELAPSIDAMEREVGNANR
jgi:hypothetical protein